VTDRTRSERWSAWSGARAAGTEGIAPQAEAGYSIVAMLVALAGAVVVGALVLASPTPYALTSDNATVEHPLLADAYRQLRAGDLPLWTAGRWGGSPLIGDPLVGALYPPYYLAYALTRFPHARALDLSAAFHLAVLAVGTVWLLRTLGARPSVALVTTALLACNPTVVFISRTWAQLWAALAYWPWLFAAAHRMGERPRGSWGLLAAISLAGQVYAGYPQFALYSGGVALLWVVLQPGAARALRAILAVLIGLGALGLAAPQVVPGLAMAEASIRRGPRAAEFMASLQALGLSPRLWLEAFRASPIVFAPPKVAPVAAVLALVGIGSRRPSAVFLAAVTASAAFLATVPNPVYRAVHAIPPFDFFGAPAKFFYLAVFTLSVLAGLGIEEILTRSAGSRRAVLVALAASAAVALNAVFPGRRLIFAVGAVGVCLLPRVVLNVGILTLALAGGAAFLAAARPTAVADPWDLGPFRVLSEEMPGMGRGDPRGGRLLAVRGRPRLQQVGSNYGALWGVNSLNGIGPLAQWRQLETLEFAEAAELVALLRQWGADPVVVAAGGQLEQRLVAAGFRPAGAIGGLSLLSSAEARSQRYLLVPRAREASAAVAIEAARAGRALTETSLLVEASSLTAGRDGDPDGQIGILEESPRSAFLRVSVDRPTWLAVRQPYYRNWRATVDGGSAPIHPAGGFFLALLVDRGEHEVALSYEEPGLFPAVAMAVITAVLFPLSLRTAIRGTRRSR
jgi:hypothetical protein